MASISDFRNGMAIRYNNDIWIITEFQHVTPGNWRAMVRTKLKNAKTGRVIDNTFRMTDTIEEVRLDEKEMQYLYEADGNLYFMDLESYDQTFIPAEMLGDQKKFLKEGGLCSIRFLEGRALTAELPFFIEFVVTEAEPGVRGDSASNITKYATIESGAKVQVPLFIKEGDVIKIDTRSGKYLERVSRK
ncbi:elongation factor P [candidate division KSB1 bacterium]|nr:elongation factor P [candidate division KSB1 bacterium]